MLILNGLWRERAVVLGSENIRLCQVKRMAESARFGTLGVGGGDGRLQTGDETSDSGKTGSRARAGAVSRESD